MIITEEITQAAYEISKQVYENKIKLTNGIQLLVQKTKMNKNSAADYINNFRKMMDGEQFTRTNNAFAVEYYLENIRKDYGVGKLNNALAALKSHIEYYEDIQKVTMHKMRGIYDKFISLPIDIIDEQEQNEIIRELHKQNKTKQDIINDLKKLKPKDSEMMEINGKTYKRNNWMIAQIKILRDFKCQICSISIKKKDGTFYVEAAHIKPKHLKGLETPDNILLLCPNHHKEFDLGKREKLTHDKNFIKFKLNEKEYEIALAVD